MGKFDKVLICTDLDGTLYRDNKTISEENKAAIEYFKREGGSFTFVTGRLPYYSADAFDAVRPNVPYGCINGGGIYDGENKKYIWTMETPLLALELVRCIDEAIADLGIQICGFDKTYFARENSATVRFREVTGIPNYTCDYRTFTEPLAKIILCSEEEEKILSIKAMLERHKDFDKFDFIRSERTFYEILPKGVHKGLAVERLARYLDIDMKRTIAVGDYDNDAAMLRAAGWGIAVANASAAALAAADIVTVSNEENAIARIIEDLEIGKYIR